MKVEAIFFDDGGVLNNNKLRGPQWQPLVADFFSPRYGGNKESWMKANVYAMDFVIDILKEIIENNTDASHKEYYEHEHKVWIEKMFDFVGIPYPAKEDYEKIHHEVNEFVIPHVKSDYPGISEEINQLATNFTIHTASNAPSGTLDLILKSMNIRQHFNLLFGPDLIGLMKNNQSYYNKIFSHANIEPEKAVIIDDNPRFLHYASKTGAKVIQSCLDNQTPEFANFFTQAKELRPLIDSLTK